MLSMLSCNFRGEGIVFVGGGGGGGGSFNCSILNGGNR